MFNSSSAGQSVAMMMRVITASAPRSARLRPPNVYGRFGHPMELRCRGSSDSKPTPRVAWFKDGVAIVISDRLQIESTKLVDHLIVCMMYCCNNGPDISCLVLVMLTGSK